MPERVKASHACLPNIETGGPLVASQDDQHAFLSRRQMLRTLSLAGGATRRAACAQTPSPSPPTAPAKPTTAPVAPQPTDAPPAVQPTAPAASAKPTNGAISEAAWNTIVEAA